MTTFFEDCFQRVDRLLYLCSHSTKPTLGLLADSLKKITERKLPARVHAAIEFYSNTSLLYEAIHSQFRIILVKFEDSSGAETVNEQEAIRQELENFEFEEYLLEILASSLPWKASVERRLILPEEGDQLSKQFSLYWEYHLHRCLEPSLWDRTSGKVKDSRWRILYNRLEPFQVEDVAEPDIFRQVAGYIRACVTILVTIKSIEKNDLDTLVNHFYNAAKYILSIKSWCQQQDKDKEIAPPIIETAFEYAQQLNLKLFSYIEKCTPEIVQRLEIYELKPVTNLSITNVPITNPPSRNPPNTSPLSTNPPSLNLSITNVPITNPPSPSPPSGSLLTTNPSSIISPPNSNIYPQFSIESGIPLVNQDLETFKIQEFSLENPDATLILYDFNKDRPDAKLHEVRIGINIQGQYKAPFQNSSLSRCRMQPHYIEVEGKEDLQWMIELTSLSEEDLGFLITFSKFKEVSTFQHHIASTTPVMSFPRIKINQVTIQLKNAFVENKTILGDFGVELGILQIWRQNSLDQAKPPAGPLIVLFNEYSAGENFRLEGVEWTIHSNIESGKCGCSGQTCFHTSITKVIHPTISACRKEDLPVSEYDWIIITWPKDESGWKELFEEHMNWEIDVWKGQLTAYNNKFDEDMGAVSKKIPKEKGWFSRLRRR